MNESCLLLAAPMAALAHLKLAPTLSLRVRRFETDDLAAHRQRDSEGLGPLEPKHRQETEPPSSPRLPRPRRDATLGQMLLAGVWSRAIAPLALKRLRALADAGLRP